MWPNVGYVDPHDAGALNAINAGTGYAPPVQFAPQGPSGTESYTPYAGYTPAATAAPVDNSVNWNGQWFANAGARDAEIGRRGGEIDIRKGSIIGEGQSAFGDVYNSYDTQGRELANTIRLGQQGIDVGRQNTALNRMRSITDLVDNVRQGLQSGGVRLANMNALDSSGAEAMARAYSRFGTKQRGSIMNQAALKNEEFNRSQQNLDIQENEGVRRLGVFKQTETDRIGRSVLNQLRELDITAQGMGVGGRFQVEGEKQRVINEGVARLAEIDNYISQQRGAINPMDAEGIETEARRLNTLGALPANDFQYASSPGITQNQPLAPISQLPIFTRRRDEL